jgi:hypothetical protein
MVYKQWVQIIRDASQQATQGESFNFIEESEPGDLAFFDNDRQHNSRGYYHGKQLYYSRWRKSPGDD